MRSFLFLLIAASINTFASAAFPATEEPMTLNDAVQRHLLEAAALPRYPEMYRYQPGGETLVDDGIFDLKFDYETGQLREIHVVKSTGNLKLDARAILAFKVWKAKSRTIHTLRVPITFRKRGHFNSY